MSNNQVENAITLLAMLDALAETHGMRLVAASLAVPGDKGGFSITSFNPHMASCRCECCKTMVADIKAAFNRCDAYGAAPKQVTQ